MRVCASRGGKGSECIKFGDLCIRVFPGSCQKTAVMQACLTLYGFVLNANDISFTAHQF